MVLKLFRFIKTTLKLEQMRFMTTWWRDRKRSEGVLTDTYKIYICHVT